MNATTIAAPDVPLGRRGFDLLCITMAVVLALHAPHMPAWLVAGLAALLGVRWWQRRRMGTHVRWWVRLPLTVLLPVLVIGAYGTLFGRAPGSALAVGMLVLKLLEAERTRDARMGAAFACFALMSALLFSQGIAATAIVAVGLIPALATLQALEPGGERATWAASWRPVARLLALAVPLALAAFLFIPRLGGPLWGAPGDTQARTGVGDTMSPGDFTQLLIDDRPAFRVSFDGSPPPPSARYFRGVVLWFFDGRTWSAVHAGRGHRPPPPEVLQVQGGRIAYRVQMEPTRRRWLFALDVPAEAPPGASLRLERTLRADKNIDAPYSYRAVSGTRYRLAPSLAARERRLGLLLPDGYDPQARALAAQWRERHAGDPQAIVREALRLFHDGSFRYTLAPAPLGRDSVDDFLFSTREGFCEHYASAFTFLMRAAGLPARVVTGYQGGFWNRIGDYLLVRQSDAHAWSEVWLPQRGWVRVDPTAAVRPERVSLGAAAAAGDQGAWYQQGWLQGLRNRWDVVNRWWDQAVIGFDALRQRGLLTPFGVRRAETGALAAALATSVALLLLAGLAVTLRRRPQGDLAARALARLQRRLARAGVTRGKAEGPRRYLARAARALPHEQARLLALMRQYLELRYRQDRPTTESMRQFDRAVRDFRPRRVVQSGSRPRTRPHRTGSPP